MSTPFDTHVIRSSVHAPQTPECPSGLGSWLLMRRHEDGGWDSTFWARITASEGRLRVIGDFLPIVFAGHNDAPGSLVAWMGCHDLDHYVMEKACTGSGEEACVQVDVEDARADLRELIADQIEELEDGETTSESINAMRVGEDATVDDWGGRLGVHEIMMAMWNSGHAVDMELVSEIGERASPRLILAHQAVQRLHAILNCDETD